MKTTICRTRCGALGLCLLQGFFGFIAVSYADQTITVSKSGSANYSSITAAYQSIPTTDGALTDNWTIEVLDTAIYEESLIIYNLGTSSKAQLTICSSVPNADNKPTIYPKAPGERPILIHGTAFVTINGFVFKNHPLKAKSTQAMTTFEGGSENDPPLQSKVMWDYCVWDGQGQVYPSNILRCWLPQCNITVRNSTFKNVKIGTGEALVYLGMRYKEMDTAPTFEFINNTVINNTGARVWLEGNPNGEYYNSIVLRGNIFTGNGSQYHLVNILNQRAENDISDNHFYGNRLNGGTLLVRDSGNTLIAGNWFLQNGGATEVYLIDYSSKPTIALTENTLGPSSGAHFGVAVYGEPELTSSGNLFYSNYKTKDPWNTPGTDIVALWGNSLLTIDQWNDKTPTPTDGQDDLAAPGIRPPATPPTP